jgi:transmembrane sensor
VKDYGDRIVDEASAWFVRLQDAEVCVEEREAFADWLSASPSHVREYLMLSDLHCDIKEHTSARGVKNLIELARQAPTENVIALSTLARYDETLEPSPTATQETYVTGSARTNYGRTHKFGLAAVIVIITLGSLWWSHPNPDNATYSTAVGEQKSFPLPDGSVVTLNAVSKLRAHYTTQYRDVLLLSGEALFTVAKNRARPFRVLTNDSVIQAVGTQFNVYHRRADTTVTVVEGTVEIRPATSTTSLAQVAPQSSGRAHDVRVTKGQRAHVAAGNLPVTVSAIDPAVDTAWRERKLTFESRPLAQIVAEFNLYNSTPFELGDEALANIEVSGSFNANDPESFSQFLAAAGIANTTKYADRVLLRLPQGR